MIGREDAEKGREGARRAAEEVYRKNVEIVSKSGVYSKST